MFKKYFANPYFLFLLAGNLYCIWYYQNHPGGFTTVAWVYWLQSVIIGLFNFIIKKDGTVCPSFLIPGNISPRTTRGRSENKNSAFSSLR